MGRKSTAVEANVTLIRELLKKNKLTILKASEQIGVTRQYLSGVLHSHSPMSATLLNKLSKLLGVTPALLATGTDKILLNKLDEIALYLCGLKPEKLVGKDLRSNDVRRIFDVFHRFGILDEANPQEININVNEVEKANADLLDEDDEPECEVY